MASRQRCFSTSSAACIWGEELAPLRIQYKDYAVWQHSEAYGQLIQPQKEYWLEQLSGELPVLELPTDFPRPAVQSFDGRTVKFDIGKERTEKLKELAARTGTTLYMVLLFCLLDPYA